MDNSEKYRYLVRKLPGAIDLDAKWDSPEWAATDPVQLASVRPESSDHHPITSIRMGYTEEGIYGLFRVQDKYVTCTRSQFQDSVCRDSCVEFFVLPPNDPAYFNFELNCGGCMLVNHCKFNPDDRNEPRKATPLTPEDVSEVKLYHSMPEIVTPEITDNVEWFLGFYIPFSLFEKYKGSLGTIPGSKWRANFYKCAGDSSHPHWISWAPVDKLNFHLPDCFGTIEFHQR